MIITICFHISITILYFANIKYNFLQKQYSNVMNIIITALLIEVNINASEVFDRKYALLPIGIFFCIASTTSYSFMYSGVTYLACFLYSFIRTYFIIDEISKYILFNLYIFVSLMTLFFYSRANQQYEREKFIKEQSQK